LMNFVTDLTEDGILRIYFLVWLMLAFIQVRLRIMSCVDSHILFL